MALIHPLKVGQKIYFEWEAEDNSHLDFDLDLGDSFQGLCGKGRIRSINMNDNGSIVYDVVLTWVDGPESANYEVGEDVGVLSKDVKRIIEDQY